MTSLLPSSTGVVPTACLTTQEDFRMLGMSLKRLLRRLSAAAPSPSRNLRQAQQQHSVQPRADRITSTLHRPQSGLHGYRTVSVAAAGRAGVWDGAKRHLVIFGKSAWGLACTAGILQGFVAC